ncbi:MAG: hypothetical protein RL095_3958 [Verrucomicrobiota bacterium]
MLGRFLIRLLTAVGTGVALHLALSAWLAKGRSAPVLEVAETAAKAEEETLPLPPLGEMGVADIRSGSAFFRRAALEWTRRRPRETALWAGGLQDPELRSSALSVIMNAWSSHNLEAALHWSDQLPPDEVEPYLPVCDRLRLVSHPRALAWAEDRKSPQVRRFLVDRVLSAWSAFDGLAAAETCLKHPDQEERVRRMQLTIQRWFRRAPGSALRWMSDPSRQQGEMLHSCFYAWCQGEPEAARHWLESSWVSLPAPFLAFAAASLAEKAPHSLEKSLQDLEGEWRIQACAALAVHHSRKDMNKARSFLGRIPESRRVEFEKSLIGGLASSEPSRLAAAARTCHIFSPELPEISRAWSKLAPKDCFNWLKELSLASRLKKAVAQRRPGLGEEALAVLAQRLASLLDLTPLPPAGNADPEAAKFCEELAAQAHAVMEPCWRACARNWASSSDPDAAAAAFSIPSPPAKYAFIQGLLDAPLPADLSTLQQAILSLPDNLRIPLARRLALASPPGDFRFSLDFAEQAGLLDANSLALLLCRVPLDAAWSEIAARAWPLHLQSACRAAVLGAAQDSAAAARLADALPPEQRLQSIAAIAAGLPENSRSAWIASRPEAERPALREALETLKK